VRRFEADLLEYIHSREPWITKEIVETGKLSEESAGKLTSAIEEFKRGFQAKGAPDGMGDDQRTEDKLLEDKPEA
jgi:F-type H+-transporting ATPase subunit alpha